jgi:photosystem II stability/assembly factor-like uncharacterized protein
MYAATEGDGIYLSTNGGLTWEYETGGDGDNGSARKILFDPESSAMIYAGYLSLGVCISMNSGQDWESSSIGIASLKLNDIEVDPSNPASILASFEAENSGGCYIFDPFEGDWGLVSSLPATRFSAVSIGIDGAMYAWSNGPTTVAAEGLYRSVDGGETWDNLGPNIGPVFETQIFGIVCSQSDPELIFICGNNFGANGWASMIYRTTDSGESWENVFMGPDMNGFKYISIDPASDDQVVYAAYKTETDGAGFMKSSDGGTTWTTINTGIPESTKWAGAIVADIEDPEILYGGVGGYGGTPGKVYKSVNSGLSWDEMEMSLSNYSKVTDIIQSPGYPEVIYAATTIDGVYMTEDGATWSASNEGLPSGNITAFSRIFENEEETLGFYASTFSSSAFYTELYEPGSVGVPPNATSNDGPGVMPNPSNGHFRIHLGKYAGQSGEFRLSGIDGKQHYQGKVNAEGPTILPVEVDLNPGIYILSIKSTEECNAVKVIIE